jgi:hypothetical protein
MRQAGPAIGESGVQHFVNFQEGHVQLRVTLSKPLIKINNLLASRRQFALIYYDEKSSDPATVDSEIVIENPNSRCRACLRMLVGALGAVG